MGLLFERASMEALCNRRARPSQTVGSAGAGSHQGGCTGVWSQPCIPLQPMPGARYPRPSKEMLRGEPLGKPRLRGCLQAQTHLLNSCSQPKLPAPTMLRPAPPEHAAPPGWFRAAGGETLPSQVWDRGVGLCEFTHCWTQTGTWQEVRVWGAPFPPITALPAHTARKETTND